MKSYDAFVALLQPHQLRIVTQRGRVCPARVLNLAMRCGAVRTSHDLVCLFAEALRARHADRAESEAHRQLKALAARASSAGQMATWFAEARGVEQPAAGGGINVNDFGALKSACADFMFHAAQAELEKAAAIVVNAQTLLHASRA